MDKYIEDRVINESKYIIDTKDTIRNIAKKFNVSKSTVHKDLRERLIQIDSKMYSEVSNILKYHFEIRQYLEKKLEF